jgi:hypothetical protein
MWRAVAVVQHAVLLSWMLQVASQVEPALRQQRERVASGEFQRSAEAASNALGAGITGVLNQASTLPAGGCCHGARVRRGGCC